MKDDDYLSISDAALALGISRRTAYRRVATGALRVRSLGTGMGRLYVHRDELNRYLRDRTADESNPHGGIAA